MKFKLEICVDSTESAINAQEAGAHCIELCNSLSEGGTTPSYGTILSVRNNLDIDVNVTIRPRASDFLYSDLEYDIMRRDIELCGEAGIDGVTLGILISNGNIDMERTARLVEFAKPMSVTFNRAFDMCIDPMKALEEIINAGVARLISSGRQQNAIEGADLLAYLVRKAGDRLIVMPGGGIDDTNIEALARMTGAIEYHLSVMKYIESDMEFKRNHISVGENQSVSEYGHKAVDIQTIRLIGDMLKMI
jgi:copper homeostasis protein